MIFNYIEMNYMNIVNVITFNLTTHSHKLISYFRQILFLLYENIFIKIDKFHINITER